MRATVTSLSLTQIELLPSTMGDRAFEVQNLLAFCMQPRESAKRIDPRIHTVANRKLHMLDAATQLEDLRVPPGNRPEALKGNRAGQHSIRINDRWRICFRWRNAGPEDVQIADYH